MAVTATAPLGGIVADLGGRSRPLILRQGEIERFEEHYDLGIFALLKHLLSGSEVQSRHCRDIVALGLVGAGMGSGEADKVLADLPPAENFQIRAIAHELVVAAFAPIMDKKKD